MIATLIALCMTINADANEPKAAATVGQTAPEFTLSDLDGKTVSLSDFKGKTVILEWFNPGCPFVRYAHADGPLASMAADRTNAETVWLAINSSAPEKQGHGVETNRKAAKEWNMAHPVLLDEKGDVGKLYNARTTPQMFIVDTEGTLIYDGALDNSPMGKTTGQPANYVTAALDAVAGGKPVDISQTKPYGCSVKY